MTADISQTSRTTKYANVTATSNDRRAALSAGIRGAKVEARVNECHERAESKKNVRPGFSFFLFSRNILERRLECS